MADEDQRQPDTSGRGLSRRDFLRLGWGRSSRRSRSGDDGQDDASLGPRATAEGLGLVPLGDVDALRARPVGTVRKAEAGAPVYVVRVTEGLLALLSLCPRDGSQVSWRASERSEDDLAERGRFYCLRDGSIFDRRGLLAAGPAPRSLDILPIIQQGDTLWADTERPITRDNDEEKEQGVEAGVFRMGEGA